jgi:propionyl-CoA carboxylase alpha chain
VKNYFTKDAIQKIEEDEAKIAAIVALKLYLEEQKKVKIAKIN